MSGVETLEPALHDSSDPTPSDASGLAVASLVLGILSVVLGGVILGVPALICGYRARRQIAKGGQGSGGQAMAGIVLGWISSGLSVAVAVAAVTLVASGGSNAASTATTRRITVVVHVPDYSGPFGSTCSLSVDDDNVGVSGPGNDVLASPMILPGSVLYVGNTGFSSPFQCTSQANITVPNETVYNVTMPDGFSESLNISDVCERGFMTGSQILCIIPGACPRSCGI